MAYSCSFFFGIQSKYYICDLIEIFFMIFELRWKQQTYRQIDLLKRERERKHFSGISGANKKISFKISKMDTKHFLL